MNKYLTIKDRVIIEYECRHNLSIRKIAQKLNKTKSTIAYKLKKSKKILIYARKCSKDYRFKFKPKGFKNNC